MKRLQIMSAAALAALLLSASAQAQNAPGESGEYIHYRLAVQYRNEKKHAQAIEEFKKVLAVYPDHYNSYMQLAEIYAAQGNNPLVIYNLRRALVYNPGWSKAQLMLAAACAADGQFEKAIQEYQTYMTSCDPSQRDSLQTVINGLLAKMKGIAAGQDGKAHKAGGHAAKAPEPEPGAKKPASAAIKLDPRAEEAMKKVITLYDENKHDEMLAAVKAVLAIQPNHPGAYYYAGLVRMKRGEADKAKINFHKAAAHPRYGAAALYYLGVIYGQEGAAKEAVKYLKAALAAKGEGFSRKEAAQLLEKYGGGKVVVTDMDAGVGDTGSMEPVAADGYAPIEIRIDSMLSMMTIDTVTDAGQKLLAAIRAFQNAKYDDALREFKKVLAENPSGPIAANCLYNAGICYYRLRLYKDAENQFQLFLDRFPSHKFAPRAVFFKACCYQERGDYAVSEKLFRQFIQGNRNHEWVNRAYERLGDSYADLEQHKKAVDAYTQALAGSTGNTDKVIINYKLGTACAQIGDRNRAIAYFQAAIDIGEKNNVYVRVPDSYYKVADLKFQQKEFAPALDYYKKVTRKYPAFQETPWGLFQIAGIHRNLKQYREAVDTYKDLMQRFPDDYWAKQAQWKLEDTVWEHEYRSVKK